MRPNHKIALSALAGVSLMTALAGCSATATGSGSSTSDDSSNTSSDSTVDASSLKDGSYTESATYQSPGGTQKVTVKATLASGVVTDLTVTTDASDPTAKQYQTQFINGINSEVVGKKITSLKVSRVAGSSLTSIGFNEAIAAIEKDASA
jgi:uncharacterized protein with FMN-binding domain